MIDVDRLGRNLQDLIGFPNNLHAGFAPFQRARKAAVIYHSVHFAFCESGNETIHRYVHHT
jgi:hypothetical protein